MIFLGKTYELQILDGAIRFGREGFWQQIDAQALFVHGWNAISRCATLIEAQIEGKYVRPESAS